jgi:Cu(I)/Ag(I) efflux system membrane fusion protein
MNAKPLFVLAALVAVAGSGYSLYRAGLSRGMQLAEGTPHAAAAAAAQERTNVDATRGRKILYWHDPMVPGQKFDRPGKSPFMDMELQPVYAEDSEEGAIAISARVQQNLGVRTAEVKRGFMAPRIEAVGSVAYNERDVAVVQARSNGFLERLWVRAPLERVSKGEALAEIYVPDWVAAQEEYLAAKRIGTQTAADALGNLADAARQRMRLAGMSEEQIRMVDSAGKVQARWTVAAPIGGIVGELTAREGMTVMNGAPLFRINGLSSVWVNAEVAEAQASQVRPGNAVEARASGAPGTVFKGKVSAILPEVNAATRTIKARIELANPAGELVPGMFVSVNFAPAASREVLLIPSEAVIQTGKRSVVMVALDDGKFAPVDVELGLDSDGQTEVRAGLQLGQKVVVSGQFLLDSEANLKATATRMSEAATKGAPSDAGRSAANANAQGAKP